jgi:hypothetical protein
MANNNFSHSRKFHYYNIYGFVLAVEDSANSWLNEEHRRFEVSKARLKKEVDLYIIEEHENYRIHPTRLFMDNKGIFLPLSRNSNKTMLYNKGVSGSFILNMAESLVNWEDKCFVHAGAVSKNGKAILLPAGVDTGKTSMVIRLLEKGYDYIGDDRLIVGNGMAYPFPKCFHLYDDNLAYNKDVARRILGSSIAAILYKPFFKMRNRIIEITPSHRARRVLRALKHIYYRDCQELFPRSKVSEICPIAKIFFLESHQGEDLRVGSIDYTELATKMSFMNLIENRQFLLEYWKYAFRGETDMITDSGVEKIFYHDRQIMLDSFKKAEIWKVLLPEKSRGSAFEQLVQLIDTQR